MLSREWEHALSISWDIDCEAPELVVKTLAQAFEQVHLVWGENFNNLQLSSALSRESCMTFTSFKVLHTAKLKLWLKQSRYSARGSKTLISLAAFSYWMHCCSTVHDTLTCWDLSKRPYMHNGSNCYVIHRGQWNLHVVLTVNWPTIDRWWLVLCSLNLTLHLRSASKAKKRNADLVRDCTQVLESNEL